MVTLDERYDLIAKRCTLNGHPACLAGAKLEFATVRALDPDLPLTIETTWEHARTIVNNYGGEFYTSREARKAVEQERNNARKPAKRAPKAAPSLDFDVDQLQLLIQAADNEIQSLRSKRDACSRASEPNDAALHQLSIRKLEVSIRKLQGLLNYKEGFR